MAFDCFVATSCQNILAILSHLYIYLDQQSKPYLTSINTLLVVNWMHLINYTARAANLVKQVVTSHESTEN